MTWNSRLDIGKALDAAGWEGEPSNPLGLLRHPSGSVWATYSNDGDCGLGVSGGAVVEFGGDIPDQVIIAACLTAAGQLNPDETRVQLEERAAWLGCLESAGVDNWQGMDVAREFRDEQRPNR
ncbi:hypothetical protein [Streptomyces sp. NPDC058548]|uniref:hypothetical protein n=1 Tax=Streptomyces sp. NPDC058548 TaxID=3346545 RepID=UPI003663B320